MMPKARLSFRHAHAVGIFMDFLGVQDLGPALLIQVDFPPITSGGELVKALMKIAPLDFEAA